MKTDLSRYNTLRVRARATNLLSWQSLEQLLALRECWQDHQHIVVLGAGSNLVIVDDIEVPCLSSDDRTIEVISNGAEHVEIQAGAGCDWNELVEYCLAHNWYGLENLVLIPGTAGAAPVQNIGAYGRELADVCSGVSVFDWASGEQTYYQAEECGFSYRNSRFKQPDNQVNSSTIITSVRLRLATRPQVHINDQLLNDFQKHLSISINSTSDNRITPQQLAHNISRLRRKKLPDPELIANAGSFFHNPIIDHKQYRNTPALHDKQHFVLKDDRVKLSAAELIEANGWKGYRDQSGAAVSEQHALCLVNRGNASGADLLALAERIQRDIYQSYAVELSIEPAIYRSNSTQSGNML